MKKNTWNVNCLVHSSFVPSAQQTSVLYSRLTDLYIMTLGDAAVDKRNGVKETSAEKLDSTMHLSKRIENPESQQNWHSVQFYQILFHTNISKYIKRTQNYLIWWTFFLSDTLWSVKHFLQLIIQLISKKIISYFWNQK